MQRLVFQGLQLCAVLLLMMTPAWSGDFERSLHAFFAKGIEHEGAKAELIDIVRTPDIQGKVRWRLPVLNGHAKRLSLVAEQGQGRKVRRWYVPVKVHWWATVVTARQELPMRTLLQPSMLHVERQDIAGHRGAYWGSVEPLIGMRLTRPLHAHQPIFSSMVKRPPLIRRGDRVTILAGNAHFSVRADGEAMRSGNVGERVLVQNMRSRQRVQAVVVDAHTVRVHI